MKKLLLALLLFAADNAIASTWYVRTDGGSYGTTASTCNGQTDAAFTGANGPTCAVNHPFEVLGTKANSPKIQRIAAGDTVIIKNGSYRMGYTPGIYTTGSCYSAWTYDCWAATIPAGVDNTHKTKIYGEGWDTGCSAKPELWGAADSAFVLRGSSNVDMRCLDITDHASCGANYAPYRCPTGTSGSSGRTGLYFYDGVDAELTDVSIHGMGYGGIQAGKMTNFTATDVAVEGNAFSGIDQDTPNPIDTWSGTNTFTRVRVNWNGCAETYPLDGTYQGCTDQNNTGYGDGWGSPNGGTSGNFTFTDSEFRFNTSDGLDLLYNADPASLITVERTLFEGNVGNYAKLGGGNSIFRNNIIIANCGFWANFASKAPNFSTCRAGGNAIVLNLGGGGLADIVNNSIIGESDILIEVYGCNGGEALNIQNNIFQGTTQYGGGDITSWAYAYNGCSSATLITASTAKNNIFFGQKEANPCSTQTDCLVQNPTFTSANFTTDAFDLRLVAGSPAIDHGLDTGTVVGQTTVPTVDFNGDARPATDVDSGAIELGASGDPVIITASLPSGTVGVAYSQQVEVAGGDTPYTLCDESVGALPAGSPAFTSTANSTGCLIAGTPTGAGTTNFTERVTDSSAATAIQAYSLVIAANAPTITTTTLPDGIAGFAYSEQVFATGGTPPYTLCDESAGALPVGFTSTANASGCVIAGTTTVGSYSFTERVTDTAVQTDTQALTLEIAASIGVIVGFANPGSSSVVIRHGFAGLPYDAVCNAAVYNASAVLIGTGISLSGYAKRESVITSLTAETAYTAILSCDVPSAEVEIAFTTFSETSGDQTVGIGFGSPASVLPTAARVTVQYGTTTALGTSVQNTSCGTGCSVNLTIPAGLYYYRHIWQTAGDVTLATSAIQALPVP